MTAGEGGTIFLPHQIMSPAPLVHKGHDIRLQERPKPYIAKDTELWCEGHFAQDILYHNPQALLNQQ
jgi:hypothetical protein